MGKKLLSGNEAIARGAYECGVKFASAYPGTPSTEIVTNIAKYEKIYAEWSPNEKVALEVAIGASLGGVRALAVMKHVGINVAADPLYTVSYTGVNSGLVIISADDPFMHSSQNEQDNRHTARAAKIPMLEPSDSQEAKDFFKLAFDISEQFDTPVLFRITTRVCHSKGLVSLENRIEKEQKPYVKNFNKYNVLPSNARQRRVVIEKRMEELKEYSNNIPVNFMELNDKNIGIITSGISYQYAKEILPDASYLKLGFTYPLPERLILDFASKVKKIYVIEELDPFLEEQIKSFGISVKKTNIPHIGELNPDIIASAFKENNVGTCVEIPSRPPVLCAGCPHRGVFVVLRKLKVTVSGDIGCYTLGAYPPLDAMDTCFCMGASIGVAFGLEKAIGEQIKNKLVAVIGDSTFIHSGITGLIDVVYNKGTNTVCILDNRVTAMTGHQDNPATGKTLKGENTKSLDLETLVKAIGVDSVQIVNPYDLKNLEKTFKEELNKNEPSVIIARAPCILLEKKKKHNLYIVNKEVCVKCGTCLNLGCPAITKDVETGKSDIARLLCAGCSLCEQVCPKKAIGCNKTLYY